MGRSLALSIVVGMFVGAASGYLGSLMITRRMALVGDALGHVALPGMGLALLLHEDASLGAFAILALGTLVIWRLGEQTGLPLETLVGIAFVSSLAVGFLLVPQPELLESLVGDISKVTPGWAAAAILLSVTVLLWVRSLYPAVMLLNISPELGAVEGIRASKTNLSYLMSVALMVSIGVKITGSLLVGALVIVPPATARVLSTNLRQYARTSAWAGAISCVAGIEVSSLLRFPAGPSIILVSALLFAGSLGYKRAGQSRHPRGSQSI